MVRGLASIIAKLTAPLIINTETFPSFATICHHHIGSGARWEEKQEGVGQEVPERYGAVTSQLSLASLFPTAVPPPRAIFLGEQHHQPKVLSAQLQILHQLFQSCQGSNRKIHVVLEQWSLTDQAQLNELNRGRLDAWPSSKLDGKDATTSEGFQASHYLPIVKLVLELGGTVWAGFPPRDWARMVFKAEECAFAEVQQLDWQRYATVAEDGMQSDYIPPLPISEYSHVENVSWPHRTYLKSMFHPDQRPQLSIEDVQSPPPLEKAGFLAAQALKDTFLAHTMSNLLARDRDNIVVAITGVGHCEWGFGAPNRLKRMSGLDSFLVMTKPEDAGHWPRCPPHHHEQSPLPRQSEDDQASWNAKQADAIVVYEWVE